MRTWGFVFFLLFLPALLPAQYVGGGRPWSAARSADSLAAVKARVTADSLRLDSLRAVLGDSVQAVREELLDSLEGKEPLGGGGAGTGGQRVFNLKIAHAGGDIGWSQAAGHDSLQKALDSLATLAGHGTVFFEPDSEPYILDAAVCLTCNDFMIIGGYGAARAVIDLDSLIWCFRDTLGCMRWGLENLHITGSRGAYGIIDMQDGVQTDTVTIRNCIFENMHPGSAAATVFNTDSTADAWLVAGNVFRDTRKVEFRGHHSTWENNEFLRNGLKIWGQANAIDNNYIEDGFPADIYYGVLRIDEFDAANVPMYNLRITDNRFVRTDSIHGIECAVYPDGGYAAIHSAVVSNNRFTLAKSGPAGQSFYGGIFIFNCPYAVVHGNVIEGNHSRGIWIGSSCTGADVANNTVRGRSYKCIDAVFVEAERVVVAENRCYSAVNGVDINNTSNYSMHNGNRFYQVTTNVVDNGTNTVAGTNFDQD